MKKVYLAGPDVFLPEQERLNVVKELKEYCTKFGLEGVFPLDVELTLSGKEPGPEVARKIFHVNVDLIRAADGVLANIAPFRGPSLDVGTAWEMGFAYALGKPCIAYWASDRDYKTRVIEEGHDDDCTIENFGLVDNLMPACSPVYLYEKPYHAVERIAVLLGTHKY